MLQRVKSHTRLTQMELEEFIGQLLETYGDRSKYPDSEEELMDLICLFAELTQLAWSKEAALRQKVPSCNNLYKNTKNESKTLRGLQLTNL
jgi:hypothetical protein